ncbi:Protein of unknown function (DUF581 [Striga hermonthica]|uniref:FLZ-type domain-containing protein n=1 Tax=Striga hermonthica TaxID=68872 RepID=A0A9N7RCN8_STRHE|nr:Protein of unknown function (DUF581 [Striga hermonthica]
MLGKSTRPVMDILTGSFVSGNRAGPADTATSSKKQTEPTAQSPRGLKSFDIGGVGLGIVAALGKSSSDNKALCGRNSSRSSPIPVMSTRNCRNSEEKIVGMESVEEYTIVTCHRPNKSYTRAYSNSEDNGFPYRIHNNAKRGSVFHISPARIGDASLIPPQDFLSACNLCRKSLHGKDIYMYRGEKAFCSAECRYRQMRIDEPTEKCSYEVSRPVEVAAGSPYSNAQILTNGILAV